MKIIFTLLFSLSFLSLNDVDFELTDKNIIGSIGQERFNKINQKVKKFFDGKSLSEVHSLVLKEEDKLPFSVSYIGLCSCQTIRAYESGWDKICTKLLKFFPDFHKNPDLKIKRFFVMKLIERNFNLEEDLKKWPDLLSNHDAFINRLASKIEAPLLTTLRKHQNKDGSYGDKQKIYCSSLALLAFLSHGETPSSRHYAKHVKRLIVFMASQVEKIPDKDFRIYSWALADAYLMPEHPQIKKSLKSIIPHFIKHVKWNYKEDPHGFFIQSLTMWSIEQFISDKTITLKLI